MIYTLDLILTCLLLAMVVGGVAGWLTAMQRSRTRERGLQDALEMRNARMESAERNVAALKERLSVARGDASAERGRSRAHAEDLGLLTEELRYRDALIGRLQARVAVLEQGETEQVRTLRDALEQVRSHAAELRHARAALTRRFDQTVRRKNAEIAALRAGLRESEPAPPQAPAPASPAERTAKSTLRLV